MTRKYFVDVISIDPDVEELVVLRTNGVTVRCFASYCPLVIEVGKTYEVELEMVLPDELVISKIENEEARVEMLGNGFSCEIYGRLKGDVFQSFVEFSDQDIHFEYPHFNEQFVKITAERIDVSF
ncbi:hypothetical protein [Pseudomonas baetica]|uniref:hypothetical protein n=1 Tax=Pseudomonas baetica TaxID=674054 RepID=UPI002871024A|nr:hypothetical protein [Pseudomonas baetica]MDR9865965.1 hypothetical protein [Pseudomonas baetica]